MNIKAIFPILDWLPNYNKAHLKSDVSAGLTVGIMLIPQGMAYAMLAGVPPIYGLYAAIVPQLLYALLGTSRQLSVGPVAMDSLLVAVSVSQFAQAESNEYIALAILLAFMVGLVQLFMGLLRLGFLVNFLSHPVISGFTSAAALIIGFSQLKHLMGVDLERSQYLHEVLWSAVQHFSEINLYTLSIGLLGIAIIMGIKKMESGVPAPLVVVVFGVLVVWLLRLDHYQVAIVKDVPEGLPPFQLPAMNWETIQKLIPSALTLAIVAFMEAIAISKAFQAKHNDYKIVPNQELIALGMGNIVGSFFQSFPTTGGFSRSAVNDQSGAKTNLAAIISAVFVIVTLLFLTPIFYFLPKAVLASIIMVSVFKLISVQDAKDLWNNGHKRDFLILVATFVATLTIGIQKGILVGVLLSVFNMLYDTMYPVISFNATHHKLPSNILVIRFEEQLYFANSTYFKENMEALLAGKLCNEDYTIRSVEHVVLDGTSIPRVDSTGQKALEYFIDTCKSKNLKVSLVGMSKDMGCYSYQSVGEAIKQIKTAVPVASN